MKRKYLAIAMALLFTMAAFTLAFAEGEDGEGTATGSNGIGTIMDMIIIDTPGVYEGMSMSYDAGYKPEIKGDNINIILPLIINPSSPIQAVAGNQLKVVPNLGSATNTPFIFDGVHQQAFMLTGGQVSGGEGKVKTYFLLNLPIKLKSERNGGEYDISLAVQYTPEGEQGSITQYINFTVPVTAQGTSALPTDTGGQLPDPTQTPPPEDTSGPDSGGDVPGGDMGGGGGGTGSSGGGGGSGTTSTPRLMLAEYSLSEDPVVAGEEFEISALLKNTSTKAAIKNLIVTFDGETADIITAEKTNSLFLKTIKADGSERVSMRMKVRLDAEPKPQKITIHIEGEDNSGTAITEDLAILVDIKQPTRLEHDEPKIFEDVNAGDTISVTINLYNKGKGRLSNVMVELDVPGLIPDSSAFVGNMESGTSQQAEINVFVGTKDMSGEGEGEDGGYGEGEMDGFEGEGFEGEDIDEGLDEAEPEATDPDASPESTEGTSSANSAKAATGDSGVSTTVGEAGGDEPVEVLDAEMEAPDMEGDFDMGEPDEDGMTEGDMIDGGMDGFEGMDGFDDGMMGGEMDYTKYGPTSGTLTITYEDAFGEEYSEVLDINTNISEPMVNEPVIQEEPEPETAGQWWVSVLIAAGIIAAIIIAMLIVKQRRKNRITLDDDDI